MGSEAPTRRSCFPGLPRRSQAEAGLPRRSEAEAGLPRRSQAEAGLPRRSQAEAGLPRRSEADASLLRRSPAEAGLCMNDLSRLYVNGFACKGDTCTWQGYLEQAGLPRRSQAQAGEQRPKSSLSLSYNTRRLDKIAALAVNAALDALAGSGLTPEQVRQLGVISLSHNGPCIYSEDFLRDLVSQSNPALVNPMPFAESVLNIAAAHISMAIETKRPVYALNTDLENFLGVFDTLFLLSESGQFDRGIFCLCEEFSELGRQIMSACPELPGREFVDSALAVVFSARAARGEALAGVARPGSSPYLEEFSRQMRELQTGGVSRFIWSAYSPERPGSALAKEFGIQPSLLGPQVMEKEQAFMVTRAVEVLDCVLHAARGEESVLIQARGGAYQWLTVHRAP